MEGHRNIARLGAQLRVIHTETEFKKIYIQYKTKRSGAEAKRVEGARPELIQTYVADRKVDGALLESGRKYGFLGRNSFLCLFPSYIWRSSISRGISRYPTLDWNTCASPSGSDTLSDTF